MDFDVLLSEYDDIKNKVAIVTTRAENFDNEVERQKAKLKGVKSRLDQMMREFCGMSEEVPSICERSDTEFSLKESSDVHCGTLDCGEG